MEGDSSKFYKEFDFGTSNILESISKTIYYYKNSKAI